MPRAWLSTGHLQTPAEHSAALSAGVPAPAVEPAVKPGSTSGFAPGSAPGFAPGFAPEPSPEFAPEGGPAGGPQRSLSRRLLRVTLLLAWSVGLVIGLAQIVYDLQQVRQIPHQNLSKLRGLMLEPLDASVYGLDQTRAQHLLHGILTLPYITHARVVLDDGSVFAEVQRPPPGPPRHLVYDWLFGAPYEHVWAIHAPAGYAQQWLGEMSVRYDTHHEAPAFVRRAAAILLGTLLYAFVLAALLLLTYERVVRRPLSKMIQSMGTPGAAGVPESLRLAVPRGHEHTELGRLAHITNQHLAATEDLLRQLRETKRQLNRYSDQLESTVNERTRELRRSLAQLEATRGQLIHSEKLASLGALVAGVAHEVNTPLGISVTAASVVGESIEQLRDALERQTLTPELLAQCLDDAHGGQAILQSNLSRAARLIRDFKQTAATQTDEHLCPYDLPQTVRALLASLHPETKKIPVLPVYVGPQTLAAVGYPGVLMQILTNLVINSVRHAFDGVSAAQIEIQVRARQGKVELVYSDNGVGVPASLHSRIFEPLFTTRRASGGTGLGLNIVYNLVTDKLGGTLEFWSAPGSGVRFRIRFDQHLRADLVPSAGSQATATEAAPGARID